MCFDVGYGTFSFVCVIGLIQSGVNFRSVQHKAKKRFIIEISFEGKKRESVLCGYQRIETGGYYVYSEFIILFRKKHFAFRSDIF